MYGLMRRSFNLRSCVEKRLVSTQKVKEESTVLNDPVRQVFISQSNDVFTNLALEDWLYKNHDFDHKVFLQFLYITF